VAHVHIASEGTRRPRAELAGFRPLHTDDAGEGMQVERDARHGVGLVAVELPVEEVWTGKILSEQAQSGNETGPCPTVVLVALDFDL
jgi:hypothetical protein